MPPNLPHLFTNNLCSNRLTSRSFLELRSPSSFFKRLGWAELHPQPEAGVTKLGWASRYHYRELGWAELHSRPEAGVTELGWAGLLVIFIVGWAGLHPRPGAGVTMGLSLSWAGLGRAELHSRPETGVTDPPLPTKVRTP
jgi:hypothetical protein